MTSNVTNDKAWYATSAMHEDLLYPFSL